MKGITPPETIIAVVKSQHERILELEYQIGEVLRYLDTFVLEDRAWSGVAVAHTVRTILRGEA